MCVHLDVCVCLHTDVWSLFVEPGTSRAGSNVGCLSALKSQFQKLYTHLAAQ